MEDHRVRVGYFPGLWRIAPAERFAADDPRHRLDPSPFWIARPTFVDDVAKDQRLQRIRVTGPLLVPTGVAHETAVTALVTQALRQLDATAHALRHGSVISW